MSSALLLGRSTTPTSRSSGSSRLSAATASMPASTATSADPSHFGYEKVCRLTDASGWRGRVLRPAMSRHFPPPRGSASKRSAAASPMPAWPWPSCLRPISFSTARIMSEACAWRRSFIVRPECVESAAADAGDPRGRTPSARHVPCVTSAKRISSHDALAVTEQQRG